MVLLVAVVRSTLSALDDDDDWDFVAATAAGAVVPFCFFFGEEDRAVLLTAAFDDLAASDVLDFLSEDESYLRFFIRFSASEELLTSELL